MSLSRIEERVARGGHDVPEPVVRRRFERCTSNFMIHYRPLADSWILFDNSGNTPAVIASQRGGLQSIIEAKLYQGLLERYGVKMREPPPNVLELPLHVRAEMALRAAVENAMEEHARAGHPMFVWENDKVVELAPREIKRRLAAIRKNGGDGRQRPRRRLRVAP
jgi:hypothetical protein